MVSHGSRLVNDEVKSIWKKTVVAYPTYHTGIFLEEMRRIMAHLSENIRY
jgi:hypothetical protein